MDPFFDSLLIQIDIEYQLMYGLSVMFISTEKRYDVIVVMGAAVWKGGQPSPALKRRTLHGVFLLKNGVADKILFTGGWGKHPPAEAKVMKALAIDKDISENRILIDKKSTTTFESAENCAEIIRRNQWSRVIVVSDRYHLPRTLFSFRWFGISAKGSPAPRKHGSETSFKWYYYHLREIIGFLYYVYKMIRNKIRR